GTYEFTLVNPLPGGVSILPTVSTVDAFGPTPTRDYAGFSVNSAEDVNGSSQGIGVGNNGIQDGETLSIVFDNPMLNVTLGINAIGNIDPMQIHWVAYDAGNNVVANGTTASF